MAHWYHLTKKSSNVKTGPIAVSTTSKDSCPATCPLKGNGCYAESGPLRLHWDIVSDGAWHDKPRGTDIESFVSAIRTLPEGSCFRHNQAGDLPHQNGIINYHALKLITDAVAERKLVAWTYTHHNVDEFNLINRMRIAVATKNGFTINVSAHSQQHAADCHKQGLPAVCIVPRGETRNHWIYDGVSFIVCPAQTRDGMNCEKCRLCANGNRKSIVAFKAHGTQARKVEQTISA